MKLERKHIKREWNEDREEDGGDGYWIVLQPGWKWDGDLIGVVHAIHENTKREAHRQGVVPCNCGCAQAASDPSSATCAGHEC